MRIGIDIDNVISNFDEELLSSYLKHDKELRNNGIIDKKAYVRKMFDWSEEEERTFYNNNIENIARNLKVKEYAREYIDKLRSDGHYICIITGRANGEYKEPYKMTKEWLDKNNIYYDKLVFTNAYDSHGKAKECLKNNIDIMIDDFKRICEDCVTNNIITLLMDTPYNKNSNLTRVHNWEKIYEFISKIRKN